MVGWTRASPGQFPRARSGRASTAPSTRRSPPADHASESLRTAISSHVTLRPGTLWAASPRRHGVTQLRQSRCRPGDNKRPARRHKRASRACSLRASARIEAVVRAGRRCWSPGGDERRRPPNRALLLSPNRNRHERGDRTSASPRQQPSRRARRTTGSPRLSGSHAARGRRQPPRYRFPDGIGRAPQAKSDRPGSADRAIASRGKERRRNATPGPLRHYRFLRRRLPAST